MLRGRLLKVIVVGVIMRLWGCCFDSHQVALAALHLLACHHILRISPLLLSSLKSLLIPLPCFFDCLDPIHILDRYQLFFEVVATELVIAAVCENLILIELPEKQVLELACRDLPVLVKAEGLHPSVVVLIDLNFMLDNVNSCLEYSLVLEGLSHFELPRENFVDLRNVVTRCAVGKVGSLSLVQLG